jgi:uncharacterized DUF497 family protein
VAQEFKWDENKNRSNFVKHGIRFETAARAFLDPYAVRAGSLRGWRRTLAQA